MAVITSANLVNAIVKLVAADALPALVGNLVMGNLVNRDYEPALAQAGDTVNIPIAPTLVANNVAEGDAVTLQNPDVGNAQIVLSSHMEATFQIPDVTKVLAVPDLLSLYMTPAVVAIAQKIETDLLNLYASFTTNTVVERRARQSPRRWSIRRRLRCSRRRFLRTSRSIWWWMRRLIRNCARSIASANSRRRVKQGCGRWSMGRWGRSRTSMSSVRSLSPRRGARR